MRCLPIRIPAIVILSDSRTGSIFNFFNPCLSNTIPDHYVSWYFYFLYIHTPIVGIIDANSFQRSCPALYCLCRTRQHTALSVRWQGNGKQSHRTMAPNKMTRHIYDHDNGNDIAVFKGLPTPPTSDVRCQEMSMTVCCTRNTVCSKKVTPK